jgi:hypothetical protein
MARWRFAVNKSAKGNGPRPEGGSLRQRWGAKGSWGPRAPEGLGSLGSAQADPWGAGKHLQDADGQVNEAPDEQELLRDP